MITHEDQADVIERTQSYWAKEVETERFRAIFAGKEIGHRIADYVDEHTTGMLAASFDTRQQLDARGRPRARSMGDIWLRSSGIYNPINVKAGEAGKNGQQNLVSLTKQLDALLGREIDSYYLLIVKMRFQERPPSEGTRRPTVNTQKILPNVYLVDMLDYLDYVTFDSGPGQCMLKEKQFYDFCDGGAKPPERRIGEKVARLIDLLEDGDRRLIENRRKKMNRIRSSFARYETLNSHVVDQRALNIG